MEKERNELRLSSDRLESRVNTHTHSHTEGFCRTSQSSLGILSEIRNVGIQRSTSPPNKPSYKCVCVCVGQITELSSELADERNTGESASQLLETETSERLRLEKDLKELQVNGLFTSSHPESAVIRVNPGCFTLVPQATFDSTKKQMESMEMEVMEARLIRASELNGEMDDDDSGEHAHVHTRTHTHGCSRVRSASICSKTITI